MRISTLLLVAATACAQIHGTSSFQLHYDVRPREMVMGAIDAARSLHYDIVAVESADWDHNAFLALSDPSSKTHATALLVNIDAQYDDRNKVNPPGWRVAVRPLAFRDGHELSEAEVPAETKAQAEELMYAIYDHNRANRHLYDGL